MLVGGYTMDRLEIRQIHPLSIPGLVPMILGALLAICSILLWHSAREKSADVEADEGVMSGGSWVRLGMTAGLTVFYAVVLVGNLPFFWATAIFITAFNGIFSWPVDGDRRARVRTAVVAIGFGLAVSLAVGLLFEKVFLVRLP